MTKKIMRVCFKSIFLADAQGSAVFAVATQKKSAQIGRLAADKRGQFRVRALGSDRGFG